MAMDPVVAELIASREKSIARAKAQVEVLTKLAETAPAAGAVALRKQAAVKSQRVRQLEEDLVAFRALVVNELPRKK